MPELLFALLVIALLVTGWLFLTADPKTLAKVLRYGAVGVVVVVGLFLAVRGLGLLDLPLGVILLLLRGQLFPRMASVGGFDRLRAWLKGTPHQPGGSTIETAWLRMA